jgi:hypothetical protein
LRVILNSLMQLDFAHMTRKTAPTAKRQDGEVRAYLDRVQALQLMVQKFAGLSLTQEQAARRTVSFVTGNAFDALPDGKALTSREVVRALTAVRGIEVLAKTR